MDCDLLLGVHVESTAVVLLIRESAAGSSSDDTPVCPRLHEEGLRDYDDLSVFPASGSYY